MGLCVKQRSLHLFLPLALLFAGALPLACDGDDKQSPQEPVAPTADTPAAPDEAGMAPADAGLAANEKPAEAKPEDSEAVGQLDQSQGQKPSTADQEQAATPAPEPPVEDDALSGAFENGQPHYEPTPGEAAPSGMAHAHKGKRGKAKQTASAEKVTRYVNATMLNVRAKPSSKAAIVRRLLGGAELQVQIKGKWAKIQNGQWVRSKYLSDQPTTQVSKTQADGAWKQAHHKGKHKKSKAKATAVSAPEAPAQAASEPPAAAPEAPPAEVPAPAEGAAPP